MRRLSLVALLGVSVLLIPLIMAQAANLEVNGGVLQAWAFDVDLEPPPSEPPATVRVSVELAQYAGNSGNSDERRDSRVVDYALLEGHVYFVSYDKPNQIRDCPSAVPPPSSRTSPSFTASPDLTYVVCVQRAQQGDVTVRAGAADGPAVEPNTTSTAATSSLVVPDESPSPAVDDRGGSRMSEPTVEPQESPAPAPEPAQTTEQATADEPGLPVVEEPATPAEKTPQPEETTPVPTPQPCAWEIHEDDGGRTYQVEVCPDDDATEGTAGEDAS